MVFWILQTISGRGDDKCDVRIARYEAGTKARERERRSRGNGWVEAFDEGGVGGGAEGVAEDGGPDGGGGGDQRGEAAGDAGPVLFAGCGAAVGGDSDDEETGEKS